MWFSLSTACKDSHKSQVNSSALCDVQQERLSSPSVSTLSTLYLRGFAHLIVPRIVKCSVNVSVFALHLQEPGDADVHVEARPEVILGEGAEGGARPLRDTEIARGVESLMAAMRDLLNTLSYRAPPPENEDNPGQEDWDENQGLD